MTPDEPVNPFGIPAPFDVFGSGEIVKPTEDCPLAPWRIPGHLNLWVPVDHTDELISSFAARGPQPMRIVSSDPGTGYVVVVSGSTGSGKTSLINWCIDDLSRRVNDYLGRSSVLEGGLWEPHSGYDGVHVVTMRGFRNQDNGFSHEDGITLSVSDLNRKIAQEVLRKLVRAKVLTKETEKTALSFRFVSDMYALISEELGIRDHVLMIVVPHVNWRNPKASQQFLGSCHSHAKAGIVFFLESSGSSIGQDVEVAFHQYQSTHLMHLEMGQIKADDWASFIRQRTADGGLPGKAVKIADEVISTSPEEHLYSNVRELQTFLYAISQEVIAAGQEEIDMDRLSAFALNFGPPDLGDLGY
ncbi:ATP-binding protein [Streptomyces sp. NBC_00690]|uniref:ATP-binding protein n=1 Tax=Streptomyces sp. NBC_00690 TaxID=2975808 RepID=UPI002E2DBABC|nr:P-loop NTPase fold protein [Streptomyces sp. NBC_00690]